MANVDFIRGQLSKIDERPVNDGNILLATNTGQLFIDAGGSRISISSVVVVDTLPESTQAKQDILYYAKDTNYLHHYNGNNFDIVNIPSTGEVGQVLKKTLDGIEFGLAEQIAEKQTQKPISFQVTGIDGEDFTIEFTEESGSNTPSQVIVDLGTQTSGQEFTITSEQSEQLLADVAPVVHATVNGYKIELYRFDKVDNSAYYTNVLYYENKKYFMSLVVQGTKATIKSLDEPIMPVPRQEDAGKVPVANTNDGFDLKQLTASDIDGVITVTDEEISESPIVNADTLGGKPADQYVTKDTTINNKPLSENIILSAEDVNARPDSWMPTFEDVGAAASSHIHNTNDITTGTFPTDRIPDLDAGKITSGMLPIERGGTGVTSMEGSDYTTYRPRGIILQSTVPDSIPNGCIVGVYE